MHAGPDTVLMRARERFQTQDYYGALHLLDELIEDGHPFADAHQLRGVVLGLLGQRERALEAFDRALALNPDYVEALIHRGIVLSELGRSDEASALFRRAAAAGEGRTAGFARPMAARLSNLHAELGEAYAEAGDMPRAIAQYRRALELGPGFHDLRHRLARHLLAAGRYLEARDELERLLHLRPQLYEAEAALGLARYLAGDAAGAREIWRGCHVRQPEDARVEAYLAMLERLPQ
jgi:tetratricopeptide (TPR) repeat protein